MTVRAYAAMAARSQLQPLTYEEGPLGPHDVEITISHCGICHSDLHLIDDDWGMGGFPLVPGHEIIGTITALGPEVQHLARDQRVGVGWQRSSCGLCEPCLRGEENICPQSQATCVGHPGGFAERIRTDARFVFPIPTKLASENAAPLLCGGATVYSPLRRYGVTPNMRVGVIGVGGLGHLALQFARAFGCEVTAFSSTADKESEARSFGAHRFVASNDPDALAGVSGTLDFILSTVFVDLDWGAYLQALRPNGRLCIVGLPGVTMTFPAMHILLGQRSVSGSVIGGRAMIREMLEFAARHGIVAKTEVMPLAEVNAALAKLRANRARYRLVLKP